MASTDADKANTGIKTDDNVAYTTVKRRAKSSVKHRKVQPITKSLNDLVEEKRLLLTKSGYADACKPDEAHLRLKNCKRCLCLGLGSLRGSTKSLLQCALLLILRECLTPDATIIASDPAFVEEDDTYLSGLGMRVVPPEGIDLHCSEATFVYMPHCPRSLHETLLSKNEASLENLLILSNDLAAYAENVLRGTKDERDKIPLLCKLGRKFSRQALATLDEYPEAFNDMAWHWTPSSTISEISASA